MIKQFLLAPGPTPVPARVLLAMAQPIIHHRTPQFSADLRARCASGLRQLFQTEQDVLILAASGTGAMEAAVTNCFAAGDEVIVVNGGKFGERWLKLATTFGLTADRDQGRVGSSRARRGSRAARSTSIPRARGVLVQASETSTDRRAPDRGSSRARHAAARRAARRRRHHRRRRVRPADGSLGNRRARSPARRRRSCCRPAWPSSRSASAPGRASRKPRSRASTSICSASATTRRRTPPPRRRRSRSSSGCAKRWR